jgi:hydroxyacylglutathione hydrolase
MKLLEDLFAFLWTDPTANNANTYLIRGAKNILIDPGHHHLFSVVTDGLQKLSLNPSDMNLVITTHGHPDHVEALRVFFNTAALIAFPAAELDFIRTETPQYGVALGLGDFRPHLLLQEGTLEVDDLAFQVFHTPGHSPGSICLYWLERRVLFTGDVLFHQGIGRTDLPGGSGSKLKESILRLSRLDVEILLPGHGDVVRGRERVESNFRTIQDYWCAYL